MYQMNRDEAWALQAQMRRLERQAAALRRYAETLIDPNVALDVERLAYDSHFQPEILYHITPADYFAELPVTESYLPQDYVEDGFIHCTRGADLLVLVANRHFRNDPGDFVMLVIDSGLLTVPVKYEVLDNSMPYPFPHIYGPLNRDAILEVVKMIRAADGTFLAPPYSNG
jgi:uncharacterized protein (DUF952 family)